MIPKYTKTVIHENYSLEIRMLFIINALLIGMLIILSFPELRSF